MANTRSQEPRRAGGYALSVAMALGLLVIACAQSQPATPAPTAATASRTATVVPQATASPAPSPEATSAPPPAPAATSTTAPAPPAPTATPPPAVPTVTPDRVALGRQLYVDKGCAGCHGPNATGNFGPKLAGTTLTLQQVLQQLRSPRREMPAYPPSQLSDEEESFIYAYYKSLPP